MSCFWVIKLLVHYLPTKNRFRAYLLTDEEFHLLPADKMDRLLARMSNLWPIVLGAQSLKYNFHVMSKHLFEERRRTDPKDIWAYGFEHSYSQLRKLIRPGTNSITKQALKNFHSHLSARRRTHRCNPAIRFAPTNRTSATVDDSIVAVTKNIFARLIRVTGQYLTMRPIRTAEYIQRGLIDKDPHPFNYLAEVGVKRYVGETSEPCFTLHSNLVFGKGVVCGKLISSVRTDVLKAK